MSTVMEQIYAEGEARGYTREAIDELMDIADRVTPTIPDNKQSYFALFDFDNGFDAAVSDLVRKYECIKPDLSRPLNNWFKAGHEAGLIHAARVAIASISPIDNESLSGNEKTTK